MGNLICHHKGRFNIYSTVSDRFMLRGSVSLEELERIYKEEFGNAGLRELKVRVDRACVTGCSGYGETLESALVCNRMGEDESKLPYEECIKRFLSERKDDDREKG